MHTLRRHLPGLLFASFVLLPVTAFASGTPAPTPPARPAAAPTPTPQLSVAPGTPAAAPTTIPATLAPSATVAATATSKPAAATSEPTAEPTSTMQPTPLPTATVEPSPTVEPLADDAFSIWHGVVREGGAYRRSAPSSAGTIEEDLDPGTPIRVDRWVGGSMLYPDVITWGEVDPEDGGGYIFGGSLEGILPPAVPPAPEDLQALTATWIDVNLTLNVVTVYEDGQPVKMILTSPGRPGHETDTGRFAVRAKLPSQTMTGPGYVVPGVPSVEYFFGAEALHGRYWTLPNVTVQTSEDVDDDGQIEPLDDSALLDGGTNSGVAFGVPSSHGCLGMEVTAAAWLYSQTAYGTPVDVHL